MSRKNNKHTKKSHNKADIENEKRLAEKRAKKLKTRKQNEDIMHSVLDDMKKKMKKEKKLKRQGMIALESAGVGNNGNMSMSDGEKSDDERKNSGRKRKEKKRTKLLGPLGLVKKHKLKQKKMDVQATLAQLTQMGVKKVKSAPEMHDDGRHLLVTKRRVVMKSGQYLERLVQVERRRDKVVRWQVEKRERKAEQAKERPGSLSDSDNYSEDDMDERGSTKTKLGKKKKMTAKQMERRVKKEKFKKTRRKRSASSVLVGKATIVFGQNEKTKGKRAFDKTAVRSGVADAESSAAKTDSQMTEAAALPSSTAGVP